ncbi:MAG: hypothetical protein IJS40_04765 [Synergistaceae bacterium]|nr:hypothetical protein [Synergistaceae bacterium]
MKTKKFLCTLLLCVMVFSSSVLAAEVEDALTPCPEQSAYMVLKFNDAQNFLKWIFSKENIDAFMPLILASKESNEILGAVEMISAFAENTPLQSVAILAGAGASRVPEPFFKIAFTVKPDAEIFVKKIADGSASAIDVAKLVMGKDNPLASFAETMIKIEKAENNILRVDNELFMTAKDNIVLAGLSANDIKESLNALEFSDSRLFEAQLNRRFAAKDFAWLHLDFETLAKLDDDNELSVDQVLEFVRKPLDIEYGFERTPGKFLISLATNIREALTSSALRQFGLDKEIDSVKGGHIDINSLGAKSPLLAFGGKPNINSLKVTPEGQEIWKEIVRQARVRFKISEEDLTNLFEGGELSFALNDNVSVEGIKIPAVYALLTGKDGAAEKIFATLEKSQHFTKTQDGILQVDPSVSPVPCFVTKKNNSLGINVANLENISAKPILKPAFEKLMNTDAIGAFWLDFAGIQSWIRDPENGLLIILEPIARFSGQGELFDNFKEVLDAKLSVPSVKLYTESFEVARIEFEIDEDVKAEDGLLVKLIKIGKKFADFGETKDKAEENK